jgi:hypothetical protein
MCYGRDKARPDKALTSQRTPKRAGGFTSQFICSELSFRVSVSATGRATFPTCEQSLLQTKVRRKLLMSITSVRRTIFCALLCMIVTICAGQPALAQDSTQPQSGGRDEQTNLDLELYLIAGTTQPREGKIPASLDPVVKQLRETLPFRNYSLETTLVNRVRNGGNLSLSWFIGPLPNLSASNRPPIFDEFSIAQLKLLPDGNGGQKIQLLRFSFGSRIPIQTGTNLAPVFNYDYVGLKTDISVREGEPAVVGTLLNAGSSGEAIVLAVLVKRTAN